MTNHNDNPTNCSDIIGSWRFTKESIDKMNQIIDKTKIIERGGILCSKIKRGGEEKIIDLISECKGTKCDIEPDNAYKNCIENGYIDTFGVFHTHPGKFEKTLPSIADLIYQRDNGYTLMCISTPKAKENRIICIKNKSISKEEELIRNKKLDYMLKLETIIKNRSFYATKQERKYYGENFDNVFSDKYYYKFDPSDCQQQV